MHAVHRIEWFEIVGPYTLAIRFEDDNLAESQFQRARSATRHRSAVKPPARPLMWRTNAVESTELAQGFAVTLDHLIDCQVAHAIHGSCLLGKPFKETSPLLNDLATGGTCIVIARVPMRTNDDGVVLDADFDFGIRFDVDLLEDRPIED